MRRNDVAKARHIIGRAVLSILRVAGRSRAPSANIDIPQESDTTVILFAVYIGQYERKPFRPTKLAAYLGIPRSTLSRKLETMERRGFIERRGPFLYVPDSYLDRGQSIATARELVAIIFAAHRQLSEMGTHFLDTDAA